MDNIEGESETIRRQQDDTDDKLEKLRSALSLVQRDLAEECDASEETQECFAEEFEKVMNAQNKFEEEVDEVKAVLRKSNRDLKDTQKDFDDELEKVKDRQSDYEVEVDEHLHSCEAVQVAQLGHKF